MHRLARPRSCRPGLFAVLLTGACGSVGLSDATTDGTMGEVELLPEGEINFGTVSPYTRPVTYTVEVVSTGLDPVTVDDAWIETASVAELYVGALPFPRSIDPGDSIPFDLKFKPSEAGGYHGTLVILMRDGAKIERNVVGNACPDTDQDGTCGDGA